MNPLSAFLFVLKSLPNHSKKLHFSFYVSVFINRTIYFCLKLCQQSDCYLYLVLTLSSLSLSLSLSLHTYLRQFLYSPIFWCVNKLIAVSRYFISLSLTLSILLFINVPIYFPLYSPIFCLFHQANCCLYLLLTYISLPLSLSLSLSPSLSLLSFINLTIFYIYFFLSTRQSFVVSTSKLQSLKTFC